MYIKNIQFQNFKCYEDFTLHLEKGVNVLFGMNASGKTSILKGLSIATSHFLERHGLESNLLKNTDARLFTPKDMRYPEYFFPISIKTEFKNSNGTIEKWEYRKETFTKEVVSNSESLISAENVTEKIKLPIIAFFPTSRLFNQSLATRTVDDIRYIIQFLGAENSFFKGRIKGYYEAFTDEGIRELIDAWFKDAEFELYQKRRHNPQYEDLGLATIKKMILQVMNTMEDNKWIDVYYYKPESDSLLPKGLFFVDKMGNTIPETVLSDGYRNLLWLMLEIAWRCLMLNPFLNEHILIETEGIVLIDEIDLHLHPKWQQRIAYILHEIFPNIQFVLTTHSELVLSSVKGNIIKLTEDLDAEYYKDTYGVKASYALENLMGVKERLPWLQTDIDSYFNLINQGEGKGEQAQLLRTKLAKELSKEDILFVEADTLISLLEI